MADFGMKPGTYNPETVDYSGGIAKVARQLIEGQKIRSKFDIFRKEDIDNGQDLEVILYEAATGEKFNPARGYEACSAPVAKALIYKTLTEKTYGVRISRWQVKKASISTAAADRAAEIIVQTLYTGRTRDKNAAIMEIFRAAVGGTAGVEGTQIVNGGEYVAPIDDQTAKNVIAMIKNAAEQVLDGAEAVNPSGIDTAADEVVIVIPYNIKTALDVNANAANPNDEFLRYGGTVLTYNPAKYKNEEGEAMPADIFIVDSRYIQYIVRDEYYSEGKPVGTGGAIDATLDTSDLYAGCVFFNAVKLVPAANAPGLNEINNDDDEAEEQTTD